MTRALLVFVLASGCSLHHRASVDRDGSVAAAADDGGAAVVDTGAVAVAEPNAAAADAASDAALDAAPAADAAVDSYARCASQWHAGAFHALPGCCANPPVPGCDDAGPP